MENKRNRRSHYKVGVGGTLIEKKPFETEEEALSIARLLNTKDKVIHKMVVYKCEKCGKWHIGRSFKELTPKDREKAIKSLKRTL